MTMPHEVLGTPYDGQVVQRFLAEQGGVEADIEDMDGELYVDALAAGLCMIAQPNGHGLDTVIMYAEGEEEGYSAYEGPLPEGLQMGMSRSAINAHMGRAPDFSSPKHDSWDLQHFRLVVHYRGGILKEVAITTDR
ncbi:MAG: hypothetical protein EVA89_00750 [Sandaracinaceae bacterium]|nr:MAG: hypothetical protein EVA89_00750 [Sandaracinaceae bacterium]